MLDLETQSSIKKVLKNLQENLENFDSRATQNKMIAEISNTLAGAHNENLLAIEAPTGIGKTFAYLIPSIILSQKLGVKLIISSSNISLQEQLEQKDLPELKQHTALDISVNLAKGRSRYVCIRDMLNLIESKNIESPTQEILFSTPINPKEVQYVHSLLTQLETRQWNGEQDSLEVPLSKEVWQQISCSRFTCSAAECEFYEDCIFFKARKRIHVSDVVIANHDLILADIASGNSILPDITKSFIIFDEAHHLAHKSLKHFDYEYSLEGITNIAKQVDIIVRKVNDITQMNNYIDTNDIQASVKDCSRFISNAQLNWREGIVLFQGGKVPSELLVFCHNILVNVLTIYKLFDGLATMWKDFLQTHSNMENDKSTIDKGISHTMMSLQQIIHTLNNFTHDDKDTLPQARWLRKNVNKSTMQFYIHSAKINVAAELNELLFSKVKAAVLTSATLSSLNSFDRMNAQLGINTQSCRYFRLPSPFDMRKGEFIIANMHNSPKDYEPHSNEVASQVLHYALNENGSGILVLFASNAQMNEVYKQTSGQISNLWMQGNYSKSDILLKHCKCIDKTQTSVIFGLDSFSEGIDLRGAYLKVVIIAKLRFMVPNSPIEQTTSDYLLAQGQNPFMISSLPDASLKLIQASGRLIRTSSDSGKIVVLDNRLKTARWGKQLLEALPDYTIVYE